MQFDIKIFEVKDESRGKYNMLTVDFKNLKFDKNESKKIVSFTNKDVYNTLKAASAGDEFTVTAVKGEQYWEWQNVSPRGEAPAEVSTGGNVSNSKPAAQSPKSTYETPEERAKKQLYIVRQSSIGSAIDLLKTEKVIPSVADVLATAKQFEAYVFGVEPVAETAKLPDLPDDDDIPY
jgi:hypothetical protein